MSHFINAYGLPVSLEQDVEDSESYDVYTIYEDETKWSSRSYEPYEFYEKVLPMILIMMYGREKLLEQNNILLQFFGGNGIFVETFGHNNRSLKELKAIQVKSRIKTRIYVVHMAEIPKERVKTLLQTYFFKYREKYKKYDFSIGQVIDMIDELIK